jgi:hypothetical protein
MWKQIVNVIQILWALVILLGFVFVSSGFFNAIRSTTYIDTINNTTTTVYPYVAAGVTLFILGLIMITAGYFGIRGKIGIHRQGNKTELFLKS